VQPLTCPPLSAQSVDPAWMAGRDLLYFDLHGLPRDDCWYGDDHVVALTATQMRSVDLGGAVVFAINCYLADDDSPMLEALIDAGARYVIGGTGENYAGEGKVLGASLLGYNLRVFLEFGIAPLRALALAKRIVRATEVRHRLTGMAEYAQAEADALAFRAFYRERDVQSVP